MTASLIGGFNTGIQRSWQIFDNSTGLAVDFGGDVLDLEATPIHKDITVEPISTKGYNKFKRARQGWTGTITIARNDGAVDQLEAIQEQLYHQGGVQKYFTILETTTNDDGTIDKMQYTGAELYMTTSGMAKQDAAIEPKLGFRAQARQPV